MEDMATLPGNELTRRDLEAMPGFGLTYELDEGAIWISSDRKLTSTDLEVIADDDLRRFELLDGEILVTAAPGDRHQAIVVNLIVLLKAACPSDARVRSAPYDVMLSDHTVAQPDVVVARKADITPRGLAAPPLLVVEVLSPSTRRSDLVRKKQIYADAGCPHYWVVDPGDETHETALTAWRLGKGQYAEVAAVAGGDSWSTDEPFPCSVVPRDLVD
jgi:Uma2 family endonuclease